MLFPWQVAHQVRFCSTCEADELRLYWQVFIAWSDSDKVVPWCTVLQELSLQDNSLQKIPDLSRFASLRRLELSYNKLRDTGVLQSVHPVGFEELYVANNLLTHLQVCPPGVARMKCSQTPFMLSRSTKAKLSQRWAVLGGPEDMVPMQQHERTCVDVRIDTPMYALRSSHMREAGVLCRLLRTCTRLCRRAADTCADMGRGSGVKKPEISGTEVLGKQMRAGWKGRSTTK